jgi:hypothetical protein
MQCADCSGATLRGALLQSADVTCRNLIQAQLQNAVGNFRTVLPDGLTVVSCLETVPEDVKAALALHPEANYRFTRALVCDGGEKPYRIDYDPFERRFWKDFRGIR